MPSNLSKFEMRLSAYFTAVELVEFLDLSVDDIIDAFKDVIYKNKKELKEEME
jgi:hypothetical protein